MKKEIAVKINIRWIKIYLLCLICFGLGIGACWAALAHFNLKATRLFYYQVKHPYEKDFSKEDMAKLDGLTIKFRQIIYHFHQSYYRDISLEEIATDLFKRRNAVLDSHSSYWTPEEVSDQYELLLNKDFGGIGVVIAGIKTNTTDNTKTKVVVTNVFAKNPAQEAGILKRDTIITVDNKKVFLAEEARNLIRGKVGTKMLLGILRKGSRDTLLVTLERKNITIPTVTWNLVGKDKSVGLIKIYSFSKLEPSVLRLALSSLKALKVDRIIIDLRDNDGGFFESFLGSCPFFMSENDTIAIAASRKSSVVYDSLYIVNKFAKKDFGRFKDFKIACLVNNSTSSAAEFFARTLQRWDYPLIGESTTGRSNILQPFKLVDGSRINVAFLKIYFGGRQEEIPDTGVIPDFVVKNNVDLERDLQLEKAIEILEKGGGG